MKSEFLPRLLLLAAVAAGPLNAAETARAQPSTAQPPNVVFILADDLGQRDLGVYGSSFYETPHLDALARRGVRFTQAYAAANVCSPTRASLLTGRYPARLGITDQPTRRRQSLATQSPAPQGADRRLTLGDSHRGARFSRGHPRETIQRLGDLRRGRIPSRDHWLLAPPASGSRYP